MKKENPYKDFIPANPEAVCEFMKMITIDKVLKSLKNEIYEIRVPDNIRSRAKIAIERMVNIV